ncbi:MAG: excinuclease ABC subunit A [Candidatus Marinamargulisbacteria bacterium]|jgi:excinuclease ABC subunit A
MITEIKVIGAKVHNLKNVSITLPRNKMIVFTGLSGSGKSSLAFDTIYAEGQRRYMESLSTYARQFLHQLDKPDVEQIEGLSPAISIDQKSASHNPRSTVGTVTEIYDYLRILYASIGKPHCQKCKKPITPMTIQEMVAAVMAMGKDKQVQLFSPIIKLKKGEHKSLFEDLQKDGFIRVRVDGVMSRISDLKPLDKNKKHTVDIVVDRIRLNDENRTRLAESIETCIRKSGGTIIIEDLASKKEALFSENFSCLDCGLSYEEISHRLFSFNSPVGACADCNGLGTRTDFDPDLIFHDETKAIRDHSSKYLNLQRSYIATLLKEECQKLGFSLDTPVGKLTPVQKDFLYQGQLPDGPSPIWHGVVQHYRSRYRQTYSEGMRFALRHFMSAKTCSTCHGDRLKPAALSVKINNAHIGEITSKNIAALLAFFEALPLTDKETQIAEKVIREIKARLAFLANVGLEYLSLDRQSSTLSGGEFQRIRLATQIGAGLTGVLYVLDEPSIGLHQRDNIRLIKTLERLRDLGNTLIVVEHDEETMRKADYIVDIGPGAGRHGGEIIFSGTYDQLLKHKTSLTAQFLRQEKTIALPKKRRPIDKKKTIVIKGASENNLKNVTVTFPLGQLICVTGVSGSGKSSLITEILHKALFRHFYKNKTRPGKYDTITGLEHIDKVISIDQSAIGRTPRSNPATYSDLFTPIRTLFAQTTEAKIRGFKPGRFSFNVKGGRCEACEGDGVQKIEMHFLNDVYVTCDICKGQRYNNETLEVRYKGLSISDVLKLTVNEASQIFVHQPAIHKKLKTLLDVGLGYIHLGQNATTLSGGEAQRIKLAKELSKTSTGKTLYLLDEPTTGLHFADIQNLLSVLNRLVDSQNTVVVIEHNLDVIKTADHIIDLGPEGGNAGGKIVATGTPEKVAKVKASQTGKFLVDLL